MEDGTKEIPPALSIEGYTKSFGSFTANCNISFELKRGEIMCLLGENGAGKSTLCKCLYGAYRPDSGSIKINGREVILNSPKDAIKYGIGMVHQHFVLVPPFTVAENIIVGSEGLGLISNLNPVREKVRGLCREYGLEIDPDARIRDLSVGEQQWVEILKSMYSGLDVLILDEPTATLTPQETDRLFEVLKKVVSKGMSVILITHKLHEVMEISDKVVVLRKGKLTGSCRTKDATREDLVRMMVGRNVEATVNDKKETGGNDPGLIIDNMTLKNPLGHKLLNRFSIEVRKGEVFGLAGIAGNGQSELFDIIAGVTGGEGGTIRFGEVDVTSMNPAERTQAGLAQIPPDRIEQGLLMNYSLSDNMILGQHRTEKFRRFFLSSRKIDEFARASIESYDIATESPDQQARQLSGGNLQKVILARELSGDISLIVASSPTRGLDVGAIEYVHKQLLRFRDKGAAVLLISEDLDEVMNLSDRIGVIFKGEMMEVLDGIGADRQKIGLLMAGIKEKEVCFQGHQ